MGQNKLKCFSLASLSRFVSACLPVCLSVNMYDCLWERFQASMREGLLARRQKARPEGIGREKHSSLLGPFISYETNKVL